MKHITTNKKQFAKREAEFSRLLSAAVINHQFCQSLLANPQATLINGYAGEKFNLRKEDSLRLSAIRSGSLCEFAAKLAQI